MMTKKKKQTNLARQVQTGAELRLALAQNSSWRGYLWVSHCHPEFSQCRRSWGMWVCKWRREWGRDLCIYTERIEAVSVGLSLPPMLCLLHFLLLYSSVHLDSLQEENSFSQQRLLDLRLYA